MIRQKLRAATTAVTNAVQNAMDAEDLRLARDVLRAENERLAGEVVALRGKVASSVSLDEAERTTDALRRAKHRAGMLLRKCDLNADSAKEARAELDEAIAHGNAISDAVRGLAFQREDGEPMTLTLDTVQELRRRYESVCDEVMGLGFVDNKREPIRLTTEKVRELRQRHDGRLEAITRLENDNRRMSRCIQVMEERERDLMGAKR